MEGKIKWEIDKIMVKRVKVMIFFFEKFEKDLCFFLWWAPAALLQGSCKTSSFHVLPLGTP